MLILKFFCIFSFISAVIALYFQQLGLGILCMGTTIIVLLTIIAEELRNNIIDIDELKKQLVKEINIEFVPIKKIVDGRGVFGPKGLEPKDLETIKVYGYSLFEIKEFIDFGRMHGFKLKKEKNNE